MLLLGRPVTGADAADWGMIHRAVPDDELDAAADELVAELAAGPTVAIGLTKRCIHGALDGGIVEAMEAEAMALELSSRTADFREGLAAFTERRATRFEGPVRRDDGWSSRRSCTRSPTAPPRSRSTGPTSSTR